MKDIFLTTEEIADRLRVPKSWIYAQTRQKGPNTIPVVRVGKYCRFREADVMAWLESKQKKDEDDDGLSN